MIQFPILPPIQPTLFLREVGGRKIWLWGTENFCEEYEETTSEMKNEMKDKMKNEKMKNKIWKIEENFSEKIFKLGWVMTLVDYLAMTHHCLYINLFSILKFILFINVNYLEKSWWGYFLSSLNSWTEFLYLVLKTLFRFEQRSYDRWLI